MFHIFVSHLVYYPYGITNYSKVLDAAKQFASIGLSIVACIQSVSIIILQQQWMQAYMPPNWIPVLEGRGGILWTFQNLNIYG